MCSRLFKGNKESVLIKGKKIPCVGPKGAGKARFAGFARSERLEDLWLRIGGVYVDLHWSGFAERKPNTSYWIPEGFVIRGIGIPKTGEVRILTRRSTPAIRRHIKHHRQPVIRRPIYAKEGTCQS